MSLKAHRVLKKSELNLKLQIYPTLSIRRIYVYPRVPNGLLNRPPGCSTAKAWRDEKQIRTCARLRNYNRLPLGSRSYNRSPPYYVHSRFRSNNRLPRDCRRDAVHKWHAREPDQTSISTTIKKKVSKHSESRTSNLSSFKA